VSRRDNRTDSLDNGCKDQYTGQQASPDVVHNIVPTIIHLLPSKITLCITPTRRLKLLADDYTQLGPVQFTRVSSATRFGEE
jgi:hypothetical protein